MLQPYSGGYRRKKKLQLAVVERDGKWFVVGLPDGSEREFDSEVDAKVGREWLAENFGVPNS